MTPSHQRDRRRCWPQNVDAVSVARRRLGEHPTGLIHAVLVGITEYQCRKTRVRGQMHARANIQFSIIKLIAIVAQQGLNNWMVRLSRLQLHQARGIATSGAPRHLLKHLKGFSPALGSPP